ncbi:hypothetical protein BDZ45DRAFT_669356 [Acephala macrosclerotiorum]|nr:hypothetical protein BDZ45DRAFT_669356 [Acephala macrosclerotiorum]
MAIEQKLINLQNRENEWTYEEYVRRFETGDMDYSHLKDAASAFQLQTAFLKSQNYLRLGPSTTLITNVAARMTLKWTTTPFDLEDYAKDRFEAAKDCLEEIAIHMPELVPHPSPAKLQQMLNHIFYRKHRIQRSGPRPPVEYPAITITTIPYLNNLSLDATNPPYMHLHARTECELVELHAWIFCRHGDLNEFFLPRYRPYFERCECNLGLGAMRPVVQARSLELL